MKKALLIVYLLLASLMATTLIPAQNASAEPFNRPNGRGYFKGQADSCARAYNCQTLGNIEHVYDINSFVNYYAGQLSGDTRARVSASFTIRHMLGIGPPGSNAVEYVGVGDANWQRWESRVRAYNAAGKINFTQNFAYDRNTYYQRNQNDVAWNTNADTRVAVVFYHPMNNSVAYAIKKDCANPVGNFSGLPEAAQWTTVGNSYIKNAGKVGDYDNLTSAGATQAEVTAEPGDKLRWYHYVQNNSGYPMSQSIYFRGDRIGFSNGLNGIYDTQGYASGGPGVNFVVETADRPGGARPYTLHGVSQADVGNRLCQREMWTPAAWNNPGVGASNFACANVPYNYDLRPRVTTSFSGERLTEGTTATLNVRVQNEGPTKANGPVDSTMYEFVIRPGETISPEEFEDGKFNQEDDNTFYHQGMTQQNACSDISNWFSSKLKTNSCKPLDGNGGGQITVGGGRGPYGTASSIVNGADYEPGDRVCRFLVINNVSDELRGSSTKRASTPFCLSVGKNPKVQVHGGNLSVGKTFGDGMKATSLVQTSLASRTETRDVPAESSEGTVCGGTTRLRGASPEESIPGSRPQSNYDLYPAVSYCEDKRQVDGETKKVVIGSTLNLDARVINTGTTPNPNQAIGGEVIPNTVYQYRFTKEELEDPSNYNDFIGAFTGDRGAYRVNGGRSLPDGGTRSSINYGTESYRYVQTYYDGGGATGCSAWVRVKILGESTNDSSCTPVALDGNGGQFWKNNDYNYITDSTGKITINIDSTYNPGDKLCYFTAVRKFNNQYNWTTAAGQESKADGDSSVPNPVRREDGRHSWVRRISMPTCVDVIANEPTTVTSSKLFGSWVEYSILAPATVTGTASGSGLNVVGGTDSTNQANWSKLTYGNNRACEASDFGCYASGDETLPDPSLRYPVTDDTERMNGAISANDLPQGVVTVPNGGSLNLSDGIIPRGKWVVINAPNANVHVAGDITYESGGLSSAADLPQLVIIARNITIDPSVRQVNAWLVAKPDGAGDGGIINTCTNSGNATNTDRLTVRDCDQLLTVNGPVVSNRLILRRTAGSGNGDQQGEPAEVFNLRPDAYLWAYSQAGDGTNLRATSVRELPPRW